MLTLFKKIFIWWNQETIGTKIQTLLYGKLKGEPKGQGIVLLNPFTTTLLKIPTRTVNKEIKLNLPSKEGLNVAAEISILYHVEQEKALDIINDVGGNFQKVLILSTFRSASADVCARFFAKDIAIEAFMQLCSPSKKML